MMGTLYIQMLVLLVILVHPRHASCSTSSSRVGKPKIKCIEAERRALLSIKDHLHNVKAGDDLLSSWGNSEEDGRNVECCKWAGIGCNNNSGHVVRLDLSPSTFGRSNSLRGNISPSLLELKYLTHLDLSSVDFTGSRIPSSIGSLSQLRYLNLSDTRMSAEIPPQLANLSGLQVLDLSKNYELPIKSLEWVSHLSSLRIVDLSGVNLSRANDWVQRVNQLPKLKNLKLGYCDLLNVVNSPSLSFVNSSTSIAVLDLWGNHLSLAFIHQWVFNSSNSLVYLRLMQNQFGGSIPESFGKMAALNFLDLWGNRLNGSIPDIFGNMSALAYLDLGSNMFEGEIPKSIWNISTLHTLRVSSNNLSGYLPETTFRQLKDLEHLDLSRNSFRGVIFEAHFSNLSNLSYLDLSFNSLALNVIHSDWIPPFRLDVILLGSCKLGTQFPNWLRTQQNYSHLDISNSGISDSVPDWFWDLSTRIQSMNLSNNQITGEIENSSLEFQDYLVIDLSSNRLEGSIPSFLFRVSTLNLSQNGFSKIDFQCNVRGDTRLGFLDISYNKLSGKLPDCWSHFKELKVLLLKNNELSGKIPISIGSLIMIETLRLTNNNFTGELPSTLKNCSELVDIDFGENGLSGPIPTWIGKSFPKLVLLSLRSNNFNGSIPSNLCNLSNLQVLDLSLNEITGSIPKCLSSFSAMKERQTTTITHERVLYRLGDWAVLVDSYEDKLQLEWKGKLTEFKRNLVFVKNIDLSSNKLIGEIPTEIADLVELVSLNLSRNNLSGKIPSMIGQLRSLDVLDLSRNHLVGQIPSSLTHIYRLSTFNVSNNNLSGKIPTSTQLQSFNETAYTGNPLLCGDPLPKSCQKVQEQTSPEVSEEGADDQLLNRGFYICMALGFAISFWGVSGTLIFGKSFRCASKFKLLNDVEDFIGTIKS